MPLIVILTQRDNTEATLEITQTQDKTILNQRLNICKSEKLDKNIKKKPWNFPLLSTPIKKKSDASN